MALVGVGVAFIAVRYSLHLIKDLLDTLRDLGD